MFIAIFLINFLIPFNQQNRDHLVKEMDIKHEVANPEMENFRDKFEIQNIEARKVSFEEGGLNFKGIEYQLFLKVSKEVKEISSIGIELKYPDVISKVLGTTSSAISYGLTKVKEDVDYDIFNINFLEANNTLSDSDIKELINNRNEIEIVIYFNDAIVKCIKNYHF
jgi:hypothetical protein